MTRDQLVEHALKRLSSIECCGETNVNACRRCMVGHIVDALLPIITGTKTED